VVFKNRIKKCHEKHFFIHNEFSTLLYVIIVGVIERMRENELNRKKE
jgi:hypothetical protein